MPRKATYRQSRGIPPQELLWYALREKWPDVQREYLAIPNRLFRVDFCFADIFLAIEVDGWTYHGKYLKQFRNDRHRQNLLVKHHWWVLRFAAGDILRHVGDCLDMIEVCMTQLRSRDSQNRRTAKDDSVILDHKAPTISIISEIVKA